MTTYARVTFRVPRNVDWNEPFQIKSSKTTAYNLTGVSLVMTLKHKTSGSTFTLSTANGRIAITDAVNGQISIAVSKATLAALAIGEYEHDLVATDAGSHTQLIWDGALYLVSGVTP